MIFFLGLFKYSFYDSSGSLCPLSSLAPSPNLYISFCPSSWNMICRSQQQRNARLIFSQVIFRLFFRWPQSLAACLESTNLKVPSSREIQLTHGSFFSSSSLINFHSTTVFLTENQNEMSSFSLRRKMSSTLQCCSHNSHQANKKNKIHFYD